VSEGGHVLFNPETIRTAKNLDLLLFPICGLWHEKCWK